MKSNLNANRVMSLYVMVQRAKQDSELPLTQYLEKIKLQLVIECKNRLDYFGPFKNFDKSTFFSPRLNSGSNKSTPVQQAAKFVPQHVNGIWVLHKFFDALAGFR
jgi:hypothetical protein